MEAVSLPESVETAVYRDLRVPIAGSLTMLSSGVSGERQAGRHDGAAFARS